MVDEALRSLGPTRYRCAGHGRESDRSCIATYRENATGTVERENMTVFNRGAFPAFLYYYQGNMDLYKTRMKPSLALIRDHLQGAS